ncbi:Crp/Fnr family transcriptional regulator [Psychromarinibacter sp. C21-152]|uniref:Crp/Fnr family transcriptional regulator n=1 Tax=Psychromarinibacter sediminicola TaxID=3033385 RepID=A0AAE3NP73_9RHOB|nr:Crp/Fnr family transcriptional regulator [Psychromarinibacter sediminicola]MDF0599457.1 Crp/Fnr family transcriptional regulator [Psychromarinibacter sediminicola]
MKNATAKRLGHGAALNREDLARLDRFLHPVRRVPAGTDLIQRGETVSCVRLMISGLSARYKLLPDGRRSIMALLLPGDFCDLHVGVLGHMDHSVMTLAESEVVETSQSDIDGMMGAFPNIARGMRWIDMVDQSITREWLVSMGRRRADRQMAHFFCEIYHRMDMIDEVGSNSFALPMTQEELADTLGITPVHALRVLQSLRQSGMVQFQDGRISIPKLDSLETFAEFEGDYLHLGRS